jgi:D-alanyl-D-alanine carboxypeptidase
MSLDDCMYAMMLASANECADAIAEHIGGTKEKFVEMMNKKAKE